MTNTVNPTTIVSTLDSGKLQARLRDLAAEQAAVRVLLRAARARDRLLAPSTPRKAVLRDR